MKENPFTKAFDELETIDFDAMYTEYASREENQAQLEELKLLLNAAYIYGTEYAKSNPQSDWNDQIEIMQKRLLPIAEKYLRRFYVGGVVSELFREP